MFGSHPGSWGGLPDFGITEAIQSILQPGNTSSPNGGSNLIPSSSDYNQAALGTTGNVPTNSGSPTSNQVLGAGTSNTGGGNQNVATPASQQPSGSNPTDSLDAGYNSYISSLNDTLNSFLPAQASAQNQEINSQGQIAQNNLDLNNTQNTNQLNQYQSNSLKDIGNNIASGFRAGNVYLGARGAGDSSAANQYAYALTKMGSQQRGSVMQDVQNKAMALKNTYDTATSNLKSDVQNKLSSVAQWFAQQQEGIRNLQGQAALQKSQEIYNAGMQALATIQQGASNQKAALDTWVANNATSLQSAISQMNQVNANNPIPTTLGTQLGSTSSTPSNVIPIGLGATGNTNQQTDIFGNPIANA